MRPGSVPWLLAHELRLAWRETAGRWDPRFVLGLVAALLLTVHALLWIFLRDLRGAVTLTPEVLPFAYLATAALLLGAFGFATSLAMNRSLLALFERGDLDLLVSSPLPSKTIFASRLTGVVLVIALVLGVFVIPLASAGLIMGLPQLLGLYPALVCLALVATSLGVLVTLGLVRLFGARAARTITQIIASLAGAAFILLVYFAFMLRDTPMAFVDLQGLLAAVRPGGPLAPERLIWLPVRIVFFDPPAVTLSLLASAALFWLTVSAAHRDFVAGTRQSLTVRRAGPSSERRPVTFQRGLLRVVVLKEWRLILRDPSLLSQTLLQLLYLVPLAFLFLREGEGEATLSRFFGLGLGAMVVALGGSLASSLARICVSGEEAPELLAASPVSAGRMRRLKLVAALVPAWVVGLPVLTLLLQGVAGWFVPLLCFLGATLSVGVLNIWNARPVKRSDLFKRQAQTGRDPVLAIIEGLVLMGWVAASFGLYDGAWWGLLGLVIGLLGPAAAYVRVQRAESTAPPSLEGVR
jgi:ABC-2 type transport system permease protein